MPTYQHRSSTVTQGPIVRGLILVVVLVLLIWVAFGWYWSSEPEFLDLDQLVEKHSQDKNITGVATTATLMAVVETLLDKPGGYLSNDVFPPGVWLDNIPSWEYGVLIQARDLSKAMRDRFSRSQSQSTEDDDLALVEPRFNFDSDSWALPASESEYRDGLKYLNKYMIRLSDDDQYNAQFFARADNLRFWLSTVGLRLGSLSQRLSASVGQRRLNTDLSGDTASRQSTKSPKEVLVKTAWTELDDIFYEARGTTWALIHFLRAMQRDFQSVLEKKNASVSFEQIIRELEASQTSVFSPVILNGSGFGLVANHSLAMASYISRANAAIIDLRDLLSKG